METHHILITGPPAVGKTTLIQRLTAALDKHHPAGFYTREIREGGVRKGFKLVSLDGQEGILSHIRIKGPHRVGKYGVDLKGFEKYINDLDLLNTSSQLLFLDEIGKMECFSKLFINLVEELLSSQRIVVATIAARGGGFIADVKQRKDCELVTIQRGNQDRIFHELSRRIDDLLSARRKTT